MDEFHTGKKASEMLNVHQRTLMNWDKKGIIQVVRTPSNIRLYNVQKYLDEHSLKCKPKKFNIEETTNINIKNITGKIDICYVRTSFQKNEKELEKQYVKIKQLHPDSILIKDIGSGMSMERKGLLTIIELAIDGKINKLIISNKDKLCKIGFELIEFLIKKYSNGEIIVLNKNEEIEPEDELMKDVLDVMNIFTNKMNIIKSQKNN